MGWWAGRSETPGGSLRWGIAFNMQSDWCPWVFVQVQSWGRTGIYPGCEASLGGGSSMVKEEQQPSQYA